MILQIDKSFEKDTDKVKDRKLKLKIAACINQVIESKTVLEIQNLKKLTGFPTYYRIRIGDYRVGLRIVNNEVFFERFLNRKEIYKYYP